MATWVTWLQSVDEGEVCTTWLSFDAMTIIISDF